MMVKTRKILDQTCKTIKKNVDCNRGLILGLTLFVNRKYR